MLRVLQCFSQQKCSRKYSFHGYILGVLTHTTAWDQHRVLNVTKNAYISLLMHTKQLLLVTFCRATAGNGASFQTHGRTNERANERMDRQTWKLKLLLRLLIEQEYGFNFTLYLVGFQLTWYEKIVEIILVPVESTCVHAH